MSVARMAWFRPGAISFRMIDSEYGSAPGQNMKSEFADIRDGKFYLPDVGNHRINVFDLTGKALFEFGERGTAPGQFNTPEAAKFDSQGRLFVSDDGVKWKATHKADRHIEAVAFRAAG